MPEPLSLEEIRHVARLARLRLDAAELERARTDLAAVIEHVARLAELDLDDVEPLAHPAGLTNRLDEDVPAAPMPIAELLANAPATEGPFLAVPRVLADDAGG